ncbi:hypothetical protein PJI17_03240 [Mycobacterium kansasii]
MFALRHPSDISWHGLVFRMYSPSWAASLVQVRVARSRAGTPVGGRPWTRRVPSATYVTGVSELVGRALLTFARLRRGHPTEPRSVDRPPSTSRQIPLSYLSMPR